MMDHTHCNSCISSYCSHTECPVVYCTIGCCARLHKCKEEDHATLCPQALVNCINVESGCSVVLPRCQMSRHLMSCPAYVVICCFQWVRKMLQNSAPNHTHFVRKPRNCHKQLDLALTFFDQKRGSKKLAQYVGREGSRACQNVEIGKDHFNYSYKYNPAHPKPGPLPWYRTGSALCKPLFGRRPPYMNPVPRYLQNCAAYKPPSPLHWTKPIFLIANKLPNKVKVHITEKQVEIPASVPICAASAAHEGEDECTRIETSFSCYNIIAINNLPRLHRSEASVHLSCGQLLRRDQITHHLDAVHNRIMAGIMDGWMVNRCPLAVYGCEYNQIRVQPKGGKQEVKFDEDIGVFHLRSKEELPPPLPANLPKLPAEIWCLIGQYCDSYTLYQLSLVSSLHQLISSHLLYSRGLITKKWSPCPRTPRLWSKHRKPDWGVTASLSSYIEWELAPIQHMSKHLAVCPYYVRTEHSPDLACVFGLPIIDPTKIFSNFC